jgi:flavin reductase
VSAPSRQDYRDAMARLGSAVSIITTDGPGGRAGFTASAVCSVTDEPPTLLVCINRSSSAYPAFAGSPVLCVNTVGAGQQALCALFGGRTAMAERFAGARWDRLATGAPVLAGALVSFDCRVVGRTAVGTHEILWCEAQALRHGGAGGGLIYFDRRYHEVAAG